MMNTDQSFWAQQKFPFKLHKMLDILEGQGDDHIAGWNPNGLSFRIKKPEEFVRKIMPYYFNQTKYKSFQRQLNIYGFQKIHYGPNKGGYVHACLVQGIPDLCLLIKRQGGPESKALTAKKFLRPTLTNLRNVSLLRTTRSYLIFSINSTRACLLTASS